MSLPLGAVNVASGSHCWMTRIASYHIGPAVVEPCAVAVYRRRATWPFSVTQCPSRLAPATIAAVARFGV